MPKNIYRFVAANGCVRDFLAVNNCHAVYRATKWCIESNMELKEVYIDVEGNYDYELIFLVPEVTPLIK